MATSAATLTGTPRTVASPKNRAGRRDLWMLAGIAIAIGAAAGGIALTGVNLRYFLQPTGLLIVLGGTLGVTLVAAPRAALFGSARRLIAMQRVHPVDREALMGEMIAFARLRRSKGMLGIEAAIFQASHKFFHDALLMAIDVSTRDELKSGLETKIRLAERHGDADAKALEVAGGFAPTIGVLGTVVGLIDVLRQFSSLSAVGGGIGIAFVSTIYGLALANLVLLPAAHRIRAHAADTFEVQEMIMEGVLCLHDGIHPSLMKERLSAFLRAENSK